MKKKRGLNMPNDIGIDKFESIDRPCESCKYCIIGSMNCSKYPKRVPSAIMKGTAICEHYKAYSNIVMNGIMGLVIAESFELLQTDNDTIGAVDLALTLIHSLAVRKYDSNRTTQNIMKLGYNKDSVNGEAFFAGFLPLAYYLKDIELQTDRTSFVEEIASNICDDIYFKAACCTYIELARYLVNGYDITEACNVMKKNPMFTGQSRLNKIMDKAISCILSTQSFMDAVVKASKEKSSYEGLCALTGGLAGIIYGIDSNLKEWNKQEKRQIHILKSSFSLYRYCYYKSNQTIIAEHLRDVYSFNEKKIKDQIDYLREYSDIYEEYLTFLKTREFPKEEAVTVEGYTAKLIYESTYLKPLGAYNYLVYLRHDPDKALKNLKKGLPQK